MQHVRPCKHYSPQLVHEDLGLDVSVIALCVRLHGRGLLPDPPNIFAGSVGLCVERGDG